MTLPGPPAARAAAARPGHRRAWYGAAALSAVLVVLPAAWQITAVGSTRSGVLSGGSAGRTVAAVEIEGGGSDVTVTPRGDGQVGYQARVTWSFKEPTVEESWLGDTLRLTPHCAGEAIGVTGGLGCSIGLEVTVPAGILVRVSAGSGQVSVTGLDGPVDADVGSGTLALSALRGPLRARVGSGSLRATGLATPQADIGAGSGQADAVFATVPDRVSGRVGAGHLHLTLPEGARYRGDCRSGVGRCEVEDALRDPASPRTLDLFAESGRAEASRRPRTS
ncbi:DUF4097 domain-containing protein [Streptomyces sp. NBC_00249]|uniref:hypothetical protein n=1 Tax=Streptomyces sp. NBC_00249 TaxID=2975690 RepID=UPI0022564FA0|nr:hypothetical protein [Streptomyces sp. NBC_00249]MCX5195231.1 DUF4097 domain-containing protein [Streptomyces sp. NBC_00249]